MSDALAIAVDYIRRGWNPVPCQFRSKKPTGNDWQTRMIDETTAARFFNGAPQNVGVQLGPSSHGLTDVDLDCAEAIVIAPYVLPRTGSIFGRPAKRASHWLYYTDLAVEIDQAAIRLGDPSRTGTNATIVEARIGGGGKGAQTIFPGSMHEAGEPISWEEKGEPANIDGDDLLRRVRKLAALTLLARYWPQQGGGHHDAALVVGGFLARAGLSPGTVAITVEAIAKAMTSTRVRELARTAEDAAKAFGEGKHAYGLNRLREVFSDDIAAKVAEWLDYDGSREADLTDGDTGEQPSTDQLPPLIWHGDAEAKVTRSWLIEGLLPETGTGLVSGQWGTFKSFTLLDLAAAVMAGERFIDFPVVRRGGVLLIAAEGASEIALRLQAVLAAKYPHVEKAPFAWVDYCPRLIDPASTGTLIALAKQAAERLQGDFGLPLALIGIDTIVAAAGFNKAGDENDAAIGQALMNRLATLSKATGTLVLAVDHFGKSAETGTRGSSAKEGASDVVLALLGDKDVSGAVNNLQLALRKSRVAAAGQEFPFSTRTVDLAKDANDRPVTSLVIDWGATEPRRKQEDRRWSRSLRLLRRCLLNALAGDEAREIRPFPDGPMVRAVEIEDIRGEFYKSFMADGDAGTKQATRRQAFGRAVHSAQQKNLIGLREIGLTTFVWLADQEGEP